MNKSRLPREFIDDGAESMLAVTLMIERSHERQ